MWIGDANSKAQEADKLFMGNASGVAAEVEAAWIGDENDKAQLIFKGGVEAGEVVFTESTVWTVPEGVSTIDIFCVGGGGGAGGGYNYYTQASSGSNSYTQRYGGGGGGGYTKTQKNVAVTSGSVLTVAVGAGGASGVSYWYDKTMSPTSCGGYTSNVSDGSAGGASSVVDADGNILCTADGGKGGSKVPATTNTFSTFNERRGGAGGAGGSGGAGGFYSYQNSSGREIISESTSGGTDGSDGGTAKQVVDSAGSYSNNGATGGAGQGTTTRAFGESNGTLYSTGGNGDGTGAPLTGANTGDGGNIRAIASSDFLTTSPYFPCGDGKSGIVIIRWAEQ